MKIFDRLCGHKKLISELSNQVAKAEADRNYWNRNYEIKQKQAAQLLADLTAAKAEIVKIARDQTEADLFFVTAKIQKELLDGKKKDDPGLQNLLSNQNALQSQLGALRQATPSPVGGWEGVFGSLIQQDRSCASIAARF